MPLGYPSSYGSHHDREDQGQGPGTSVVRMFVLIFLIDLYLIKRSFQSNSRQRLGLTFFQIRRAHLLLIALKGI
jgi:hypothetical protein